MTRRIATGATFVAALAALYAAAAGLDRRAMVQAADVQAPRFEVDPLWPKPLPNHWMHRLDDRRGGRLQRSRLDHPSQPDSLEAKEMYGADQRRRNAACRRRRCSSSTRPAIWSRHWGGPGPGYEWPESNHGITSDHKGNVWIGGNGPNDGQILKFTRTGKFVEQFGFAYANAGSNDPWAFNKPAKSSLDEAANEAYVADGYGNHRVAVIDADTGKIKRYWGAYGKQAQRRRTSDATIPTAPPPQQFRNPVHCAEHLEGQPGLRLRSRQRSHPGLQARTARS